MTGWRPATKRPRNGQRVICHFAKSPDPEDWNHMFASGFYDRIADDISIGLWSFPLADFISWIPESELIRAARAAAKGVK